MFKLFKRSQPVDNTYELLQSLGIGVPTTSGKHVNSEVAQTLPAVYCAVSTIAEEVASLPLHVYNKSPTNRERLNNHPAEILLNLEPNEYQTPYDFKLALLRAVLLKGNGYARIQFNQGTPEALHLIHPDSILVEQLENGRLRYQVTNKQGKIGNLLQEEVIHIRYHSDDGIIGKSPITVCRDTIGLGLAQSEYGASQLKHGVAPKGVMEFDKWLSTEQITRLKDHITSNYSGSQNAGKHLVLEGGMKWKPIGLSNSDAEWLQSRQFTIADIARMFKISPIFLQDYSNSTYSNFSEASRAFLTQSLRPWLTNLQQSLSSRLVDNRQLTIEFETKDLLRATAAERYQVYDNAIRNGIMNPNECRKAENMPPREGGDQYSQSWDQNSEGNNFADETM